MLTGRVLKSGIATPRGRLLYPSLFKASLMKGETDQSKARFGATLLLPASANLDLLIKAVNDKISEKWSADVIKKSKIKKPFIKTADDPKWEEYAEAFPVMIRTNSKDRPGIVFGNLAPCTDETEVYGGRWAVLALNPFAYDHPTGGKGVSWGLQHAQLLEHDDQIGPGRIRAEDAFEAVTTDGAASAEALFG
jgi:hypothetical protein